MGIEDKLLFDRRFLRKGLICGVDEAGRGCLAGPVVAAAVVFEVENIPEIHVEDSKKLSPERREELYALIVKKAFFLCGWGGKLEAHRRLQHT